MHGPAVAWHIFLVYFYDSTPWLIKVKNRKKKGKGRLGEGGKREIVMGKRQNER